MNNNFFYTLSIIGSPLGEFSYHSAQIFTIGTKVIVEFNKRLKDAVVISKSEEPSFKTSEILEVSTSSYSLKQMEREWKRAGI